MTWSETIGVTLIALPVLFCAPAETAGRYQEAEELFEAIRALEGAELSVPRRAPWQQRR